jgi:hypothetical protein
MNAFVYLFLCAIVPAALAAKLCQDKNRNPTKGFVVTFLPGLLGVGGWLVLLFLWLGLRRRSPDTGILM